MLTIIAIFVSVALLLPSACRGQLGRDEALAMEDFCQSFGLITNWTNCNGTLACTRFGVTCAGSSVTRLYAQRLFVYIEFLAFFLYVCSVSFRLIPCSTS